MSQTISFIWECPACLYGNQKEIKKPSHVGPSLFSAKCIYCFSTVQVKATLAKQKPGQIAYEFLDLQLSPAGEMKARKRINQPNHAKAETKGK